MKSDKANWKRSQIQLLEINITIMNLRTQQMRKNVYSTK